MKETAIILLCYLIGSIPFSYLLGRIFGRVDIRLKGSGNVGATNVLRTSGTVVAGASLAGDLAKGSFAAWLGLSTGGPIIAALCGLIAVIGHCYPIFLRFHGGKGVATSAGVILCLMPDILLILLLAFVTIVFFGRYVSLASITAAAIFPVLTIVLVKPWPYILLSLLIGVRVIYHHRENIIRLKDGIEPRIGQKSD